MRHDFSWGVPVLIQIYSSIRCLVGGRQGNFSVMAALLTVPLLIAVVVPIDTVRALAVRTVVQQAADAAALAAASSGLSLASERSDLADSVFQTNITEKGALLNIFSASLSESSSSGGSSPDTYTYSVSATIGDGATILPLGRLFSADIDAVVKTGNPMIDIALVLDNSESMDELDDTATSRMDELKAAATAFIKQFENNDDVQIALVPFASQVRADISVGASTSTNPLVNQGCYADRSPPYDITGDVLPVTGTETEYPKVPCNPDSLLYSSGLTGQIGSVQSAIAAMEPAGKTNITIGVAWGMEALSSSPPLTGARSDARKVMLVMTDGKNTLNRWDSDATSIDPRTKLACETAREAEIEIYTVNFVDGDSTLLSECATDLGKAANAARGGLEDIFENIATVIKQTYLAG